MAQRIHVLHVVLSLEPGGLENGVVNVINRLDAKRFRSTVVCLKQAGAFAARISAPEVSIEALGWRGGNSPALVLRLARLIRRHRPDIVHTRNAEAFFYGFLATRLARVPALIHSEHGRTFNDRPIRFTIQRMMARHTDALFAVSAQLRDDLERYVGIPAERVPVLYNGVDLDRFALPTRADARARLGIDAPGFVVGSVGRLVAVKNYPLLLRAAERARKTIPTLQVALIGDGPERGALETLARELGMQESVFFLGHRENVTELLPGLDAFVLPSVSEGLSNTLLEAMAARVPVMATRVGGNAEVIGAPTEGILIASGDERALQEGLLRLALDAELRAAFAAAGRARVETQFSMAAMIASYERFYSAALAS
jgi:sugar transferase (PEP-CTERM/EpsH1 system associated)